MIKNGDTSLTVSAMTLGCKVSQYETEAVLERFSELGFERRAFDTPCDAYVINTCTVTAESDRKSRQMIRRAAKQNPNAVIAVIGCYSQLSADEILGMPEVSAVGGTDGKLLTPEIVLRLILARREGQSAEKVNFVRPLSGAGFEKMCVKAAPRTRAYIKIEDGCDSKCSYCAIKDARGPIRSKPPCEVIAEAEELYRSGCREIVLVGIETAAYGKDLGGDVSLADLILRLDSLGFPERIRLGSLAPELIGEEFVEKIKGVSRLAPHFHLSVQSGSDKVLRGMKRRYTSERALENIRRIRGAIKNAQFTTDMMVGFPGETEEDFKCSEKFVREAGFLDVHVFAYSRRAGTDAAEYSDQVPESVKKARSRRLIEVKNEVRESCLARAVSSSEPLFVIAETDLGGGVFSSHSDEFFEVHFNVGELEISQGDRLKVAPVSHKNGILYADVLEKM